jgi:NIMA (never in mitosis gene a)-related kinase
MEYCKGGTLRDLISKFQRNHWKLERGILDDMFMDIVSGVHYLHSKKIIHRDLKPENILVTEDYRMKVCRLQNVINNDILCLIIMYFLADFGVSKVSHNVTPLNQTMVGTLCYMSPEVYLHKPYNDSCDIWSLGLILYEIAMMKYAFTPAVSI